MAERSELLARLRAGDDWDLAVIGGGCVGLGVALDATVRGLRVVLLESHDFSQGTSSRATKLAHGGVRYLAQGDIGLVREALHERTALLHNAPHVAARLPFVMPAYRWWERAFYGAGLKMYDALAGRQGLGATEWLGAARTRGLLPGVSPGLEGMALQGGVRYWDGQFDDARLALLLARTALARGALVLNHCGVTALHHENGQVRGLQVQDRETGSSIALRARCVVNATGVWVDGIRAMDHAAATTSAPADAAPPALVAPSQGVHLVVDRAFLPGDHALLVPKTADGRVLFAVPWLGKTVLGTTDTPRSDLAREPQPFAEEVAFILDEAGRYLARAPQRSDVRSVWVGLRPLVKPQAARPGETGRTQALSREHTVLVDASGLVTVTGGKWTTYRAMAEDVLQQAMARGLLPQRPAGATATLRLLGAAPGRPLSEPPGEHLYGSEAPRLRSLPGADRWLWRDAETGRGALSEAMVRFAVRHELARSVEDVLARRCRLLFLDAAEAARLAAPVAEIVAEELGAGPAADTTSFLALAAQYQQMP
ncbi:glycerol-3-phosphate dehydrogenase/oxidase [Rubrivivax rivuli]|uniref:Glycerol-3-phosphate dehydrogenase/oxidase n=1 Tax=Rubrivivax rivuli TaxID=1862385 RepID=A0A437RS50_9BURK|nr:glycerol-3-phosphate dehydrogenase/oxidase [Rubrivivax rivuli]RVU49576.1 glycerol-3-phosphate dehydrogenase/oxidase [Rubrivivax rivuli]